MKLTFLGTGCSNPTPERALCSVNLNFMGQNILFDCPEGNQRQMMIAGVSYMKVSHIFLSHLHADHMLGLPGLIATMSMHQRDEPLFIYGPPGTEESVKLALKCGIMRKAFDVEVKEVREGFTVKQENFTVRATRAKHAVPCFGYVFEAKGKEGEFQREKALKLGIPEGQLWGKLQKGETVEVKDKKFKPEDVMDYTKGKRGKKISYVVDTRPVENYFEAIKESDALIHEATFLDELKSRAIETLHTTAKEAGEVAEKTKAKALYLIHISARHKDAKQLENEARMEFANVYVPKDLEEVEI